MIKVLNFLKRFLKLSNLLKLRRQQMEQVEAEVISTVIHSGDFGFLLKITKGRLPGPRGETFKSGDLLNCYKMPYKAGDYCAIFYESPDKKGAKCFLGPYDPSAHSNATDMPLKVSYPKA